jgi:hypothetical protein
MRVLQVFVAIVIAAASAYAQDAAPPAHISFVDGSAVVYHAGDESEPAVINMPVVQGDRIRTLGRAHVEVMFPDGASIAIDPESEVEFVSATRVRVVAGAIEHRAAQPIDPRSPSAQNLPPDLQTYGPEFDQNGTWQYEPTYGNVWYPTAVGADWRPYYDGYWSSYPSYGWTWIGYERWAWPTHHYGRWGYARSRWFWIPGRSFAAAWVSWGTAPDYVSWCPLGYDGRPVIALSVGFRSSWNAWTVIPRDRFGARGYSARRYAVEPYRIASTTAFIEHRTPPSRDRRGSFSVGDGSARRVDAGARRIEGGASRSIGSAVPRGDYRDYRGAAATSPTYRRDGNAGQSGPNGTAYQRRNETAGGQRAIPRQPQVNSGDHPAYQPRYEPQYQPRYEPQSQTPRSGPVYRDRRSPGGDTRATMPEARPVPQPRSEPRMAAPSRPSAPPPSARPQSAPHMERSAPRVERQSGAPARAPHAGRDNRSQERSSGGTAVRRPR